MIKVENLTKYYGQTLAVDDVSFEIGKNEIVGFLGPNGAGKTTTMRIITGYLNATTGRASVGGHYIDEDPIGVRGHVGYLPEMNPLYEEMTIVEYLKFILEIYKMDKDTLNLRIKEVVKSCALGEVLHQNIGELSRGYRQRVGFAAAIIHNPDVLILDEPTSGLDPNQSRDVRQLIMDLKKEKTVILSTHILSEVQAICDRVIIINRGRLIADGTTAELMSMAKGEEKVLVEIETDVSVEGIEEKVKQIPGIIDFKVKTPSPETAGLHKFEVTSEKDIRREIFELAVNNSWKVIELHRETLTLEEVFRQLTQ
ncbi:MAG: ATP-binding cassette domain-containing protein [Elusimicrobiota bacterium]